MRLSLNPDPTEFVKQVAEVRRRLNLADRIETLLMTASCVPFPTALRAELRDQVGPHHVMAGVADLLANIAKTIVRTLIDAPQTLRTLRSCALRPVSSPARCSTKRSMPRRPRCVPKSLAVSNRGGTYRRRRSTWAQVRLGTVMPRTLEIVGHRIHHSG
jgi:hypothetical protein